MATSPVPVWAQEMSPHHQGPTGAGVLFLAVVAVLLGLMLAAGGLIESRQPASDRDQGVSLCEEHPHWSVCQEGASSSGR
jgi:hypothetical protein